MCLQDLHGDLPARLKSVAVVAVLQAADLTDLQMVVTHPQELIKTPMDILDCQNSHTSLTRLDPKSKWLGQFQQTTGVDTTTVSARSVTECRRSASNGHR